MIVAYRVSCVFVILGFLATAFTNDWGSAAQAGAAKPAAEIPMASSASNPIDLSALEASKCALLNKGPDKFPEKGVTELVKWLPDPTICVYKALLEPTR